MLSRNLVTTRHTLRSHAESLYPLQIEMVIPISTRGKYYDRFNAFQQWGIVNDAEVNYALNLLCGPDSLDDEEILNGLRFRPSRLDIYRYDTDDAGQKLHTFYADLPMSRKNEIPSANWWMQCDDDSSTNLENLVRALEHDFKYLEPAHLTTHVVHGGSLPDAFKRTLFQVGAQALAHPLHLVGKEVTVTSWHTFHKIMVSYLTRDFFRLLSNVLDLPGDIALTLAARMVGCPVSPYERLAATAEPHLLRMFNQNEIAHIHEVAPDSRNFAEFIPIGTRLRGADVYQTPERLHQLEPPRLEYRGDPGDRQ